MKYDDFFKQAFGKESEKDFKPFDYQCRLAEEDWPELLDVPTGLGKTAAVVLAWTWKRRKHPDATVRAATPRRLVYCLPMRVLVEQTYFNALEWLKNVGELGKPRDGKISVHMLMGGEVNVEWARYPEADAIIVGTQDQLLSRALNRGYAMSRHQWPMHFGLLNNDCLWVMDEAQLMGAGLATTAQLNAFRNSGKTGNGFGVFGSCPSIWMSATLNAKWLDTTDHFPPNSEPLRLSNAEKNTPKSTAYKRFHAAKILRDAQNSADNSKALALEIVKQHRQVQEESQGKPSITLVVLNTVKRAADLHAAIVGELKPKLGRGKREGMVTSSEPVAVSLLIHSRFRTLDRERVLQRLLLAQQVIDGVQIDTLLEGFRDATMRAFLERVRDRGLIAVATQVVEAGVDISAKVLFAELAPWSSVVQRLGRCNRKGEYGIEGEKRTDGRGAQVFLIHLRKDDEGKLKDAAPYEPDDLVQSEAYIRELVGKSVGPKALEDFMQGKPPFPFKHTAMVRREEVWELFDTDPDLHGGFTDISRYVRDQDRDVDVHVFWRDFRGQVAPAPDMPDAAGEELCPVPFYAFSRFLEENNGAAWMRDEEGEQWTRLRSKDVRPGMTLLLPHDAGGYDNNGGWTGVKGTGQVEVDPQYADRIDVPSYLRADADAQAGRWETLAQHSVAVKKVMEEIAKTLSTVLKDDSGQIATALTSGAQWHDAGKAHWDWLQALHDNVAKLMEKIANLPKDCPEEVRKLAAALVKRLTIHSSGASWAKSPSLMEELRASQLSDEHRRMAWDSLRTGFNPGLRHECASALLARHHWLNGNDHGLSALAVYLIACHHGKVRMSLRSRRRRSGLAPSHHTDRNAFGIEEGDMKSAANGEASVDLGAGLVVRLPERGLSLHCMEVGDIGEWSGLEFARREPSWTGMVLNLLGASDASTPADPFFPDEPRGLGPFKLAYLEALIIAADWRASRAGVGTDGANAE